MKRHSLENGAMVHDLPKVSRRHFLATLAVSAAAMAKPAWALSSRKTVTVLTNYNDDTFSLFEEAFEKAQSAYRLKIVWMMPPDATKFLRRGDGDSPDVWWQASPHNHIADIAGDGLLRPLPEVDSGLPASLGAMPLVAADNLTRATQLTAFSFLVNKQAIAKQQLPWPSDWTVLAQPEYAGKVALTDPVKVRFGTILIDIVLQSYGWETGWALLSAIAGNAVLLPKGLTDEVTSGRQPVALHIDIVPNAEQRFRQPMEHVYPAHGGIINAGYIGFLKHGGNPEGARAFYDFVLSTEGQKLLPHTDLPRLPVRPTVYAQLGKDQFNPFAAQTAGQMTYTPSESAGATAVVSALFASLVKDHEQLSHLWARLHAAEIKADPAHSAQIARARHLLEKAPLDVSTATSEDIKKAFRPPRGQPAAPSAADQPVQTQLQTSTPAGENNNALSAAAKAMVVSWEQAYSNNQVQAAKLLDEVGV